MPWVFGGFIIFVLLMLALDLFVLHRKDHVVGVKEALTWSAVWIALSLLFSACVYAAYEKHWHGLGLPSPVDPDGMDGGDAAVAFLSGYVIEKSLSVDNLFVMALIFSFLAIPALYQHRVLLWGILGALVLRGVMIGAGVSLLSRAHWLLYGFGAFLLFTAGRMLLAGEEDPHRSRLLRAARRVLPLTQTLSGGRFLLREHGRLVVTPLGLALLVVEGTDVVFAMDSIPAVLAITTDPFLVFSSNVFALLGLRSLYFALLGVLEKFRYLKVSLALILALVGVKLLLKDVLHGTPHLSFYTLGMVALILLGGIAASLWMGRPASPS